MDVSIVISTANRERDLRATLESLAGVRAAGATELLVMDNASRDATRLVVQEVAARFQDRRPIYLCARGRQVRGLECRHSRLERTHHRGDRR